MLNKYPLDKWMNIYCLKLKEMGPACRISHTDRHVVVGNEDKKKTSEHLSSFYAHWEVILREQTYAVRRAQRFDVVITSTGSINEDRACFPRHPHLPATVPVHAEDFLPALQPKPRNPTLVHKCSQIHW